MLKAIFTGALRRTKTSTTSGPTTCAITSSCGVARRRPTTSGSSESESVCALPRMWAWMTKTSAAANATASAHQGTWKPSV